MWKLLAASRSASSSQLTGVATGPPASIADMFGGQTSVPVAAGPGGGLGAAAMAFAQQQMARQQARVDEQAAEDERRRALFSQDNLTGLFG